ncbi:MAG: DUF4426 domain-containing protein [Oceanococcaceae bacterium]
MIDARRHLLALLLFTLSALLPAQAEQTLEQDGYVLHYMTQNSTELTPEVAKTYGITRSRRNGVLMLNLQRKEAPLKSVDHSSKGTVRNLIGQSKTLDLRRVEADGAIYTLIEYSYSHLETLRFDIQVQPADGGAPLSLQFHQQHFTPGR